MTYHINVIDYDGSSHKIDATIGFSIMEIIRDAGLDIEAICGGCLVVGIDIFICLPFLFNGIFLLFLVSELFIMIPIIGATC